MTTEQIVAEIDKLLADQARAHETLVRIDGALQAFRYILAADSTGPVAAEPTKTEAAS